MYLNHNFHSNLTLSHSRFTYFTVDYWYFFLFYFFSFKWISRVWVMIFGKPANKIWANSHLLLSFFSSSSISHPCSIPLWVSQEGLSSLRWLVKALRFVIFLNSNGLQVCYIVFQWEISFTEIYLSLLLVTFAPKSFKKNFYTKAYFKVTPRW